MRLQLSHLVRHLQGTWQSCSEDGEVVIRFCSSPMRLSKEGFIDTVAEDQRSASSGAMPRPRRSHEGLLGGLSSLGEPDVDSPPASAAVRDSCRVNTPPPRVECLKRDPREVVL